jgi:protein-tyrosine kinase
MSEVLQLSGAWTTVDAGARERLSAAPVTEPFAPEEEPVQAKEPAPTVSVTEKLAHLHSTATPYLQYLMKLVHRLFLATDRVGGPIRSVAFSAVDTRDDSALLSAAAAELLASRVKGRVCIVDADFYSPSLHHCYRVSNDMGLIDALTNTTGAVRSYARRLVQGPESSLWLLTSGSSERRELLLTSDEVQARIRDLIAAFDYVVVAAPSVTQHPAVAALGAQVDGIVMIAEAHVTRPRAVRACADALRASGGRVLGTVLTNRTFPIPEAIYRIL